MQENGTDYGDVEKKIEDLRLAGDWSGCLRLLETYAPIFDCETPLATRYHADSLEMKAYYWLCMADAIFHQHGDFSRTIDCLRRAAALCIAHPEFRTMVAQLLVKATFGLIRSQYDLELPQPQVDSISHDEFEHHPSLETFLADQLHLLDSATREMLSALTLTADAPAELELLTCVLTSLPLDECVTICRSFPTSTPTSDVHKLVAEMILTTCRHFLHDINIRSALELLAKQAISPYSLWRRMDGLVCYSILTELLGDHASAKSAIDALLEATEGADLPKQCEFFVLFAKFRRPFLTALCASPSLAAAEVSALLSQQPPPPPPLKAVMAVFMACCLMDAQEAQLMEAYAVLKHQVFLPHQSSAAETVQAFDDGRDVLYHTLPPPHSCLHYVNASTTNPWLLCTASQFSLGHVAVLLGALTHHLHRHHGVSLLSRSVHTDTNDPSQPYDVNSEVHGLLQWAFEAEVTPNPLVVFCLAQCHLQANRLGPALHALEVCHDLVLGGEMRGLARQTAAIAERAVHWGLLSAPLHRAPHLALCQYGALRLAVEDRAGEIYGSDGVLSTLQPRIVQALRASTVRNWDRWFYLRGDLRGETHRLFPGLLGGVRRIDDGLGDKYTVSLDILARDLGPAVDVVLLSLSSLHTPADGAGTDVHLLVLLAQLYAVCGRNEKLDEETAFMYTCHTARILAAVTRAVEAEMAQTQTQASAPARLPDEEALEIWVVASLEYAVVLAELRLRTEALRCVQTVLGHASRHGARSWPRLEPRYYHLVVLLLSGQADVPKACALATVLADKLVSSSSSSSSSSSLSVVQPEQWNVLYTQTLVCFAAGDGPRSLALAEALLRGIHDHLDPHTLARLDVARTLSHGPPPVCTPCPVFRVAGDVRTAVSLLVGLADRLTKMRRFVLAKRAVLRAWQLLYALPEDVSRRLTQIVLAEVESTPSEEADLLRHVPTLLGWRLSHGCGFARAHDLYAEADVLAATARLVQAEADDPCDPRAVELYSLAMATCAQHTPSGCALALVHFERYEQEVALAEQTRGATGKLVEGSSEALSLANYYVRSALRQRERSADAWHVYSLVAGVLVSHAVALEAELTSAECRRNAPLRDFACVFW